MYISIIKASKLWLYHTAYCTSSLSNARKNPKIVRNMTALAVRTRPQAPPEIMFLEWMLSWEEEQLQEPCSTQQAEQMQKQQSLS